MHSFEAQFGLNKQKYFFKTRMERGLYRFFLFTMLISIGSIVRGQSADSLMVVPANNGAAPDSIIDAPDIGIDNEVIYFGKDSTVMDLDEQKVYLYGVDSYVKYGDLEVKAARIEFSFKEYTAFAKGVQDSTGTWQGRPVFKDASTEFDEDSLAYNFKTKRGLSYGARTQEGEAYLLAGVSKKQANDWIDIGKGKFTTCNNPKPHYYFHISKGIVVPNEKVVSGPLYLKIWKIPTPLALPFGFFPNKKESTHGILLPGYGNGQERGFFLQNLGYYIPVNEHIETTFLFDIYTRGSWVVRNRSNYKKNYKYSGNFDISRTVNKQGIAELNQESELRTFNVRWTHNQDAKARPNSRFSANVNAGSSQNFTNNLNSSQTDFLSSTFQSSLQYNKSFPNSPFSLGVSANHTQNTQTRLVSMTLPAVAVTMSRVNIFKKLFVRNPIGFNANGALENTISANESQFRFNNFNNLSQVARNGARYNGALTTSLKGPGGLTINPAINGNWLWTFKYINRSIVGDSDVRVDTLYGFRQNFQWDASLSMNWRWYGTYTMKKSDAKIKAFRHLVQPNVGWSYTPFDNVQTYGFYGADGSFLGYSQWDIARFAPGNRAEAQNINFGINQNIEAKVRDKSAKKLTYKKVKIIESFRSNMSYNVIADSLNFSNLSLNGFTTIAKNTTITYSSTYSLYDVDENGRKINQFVWNNTDNLLRMEGTTVALSTRLSSAELKSTPKPEGTTAEEEEFVERNRGMLVDFELPWTLDLNYNIRVVPEFIQAEQRFEQKLEQSATFRGSFTLFKKLAFNFDSGYNFDTEKLTTTTVGLNVDLHCWEASATYIPFGDRKSYMVQINIKSSMLRELKLQRRGNLGDQGLLY
jgi:hypothetical protein